MRGRRPPAASLPSLLSRGGYSGYGASWNKIEARQAYPISGRSSLDQIEPIGSARSINLIDCAPNAQSDRPANCRCRREQPVRAARASAPSSSIESARPPRSAWIPRFEGVEARCPRKGVKRSAVARIRSKCDAKTSKQTQAQSYRSRIEEDALSLASRRMRPNNGSKRRPSRVLHACAASPTGDSSSSR